MVLMVSLSIKEFPALIKKNRVVKKLKAEIEVSRDNHREWENYLGQELDKMRGINLTLDLDRS